MRVKLVTAYVPIPGHPRTAEEYGTLGEKLSAVPVAKKCFYQPLTACWMHKYLERLPFKTRPSEGDNPAKNTLMYHVVNHEKLTWLRQAADEDPDAGWLIWVDYGIFSQPGINNQVIYEMFERVKQTDPGAVYIPGCWDKGIVEASVINWRFCGSVLAVPRKMIERLDFETRVVARKHISSTKNVEWEVNTLARLEQCTRLPIRWYKANHDQTLFTAFPEPVKI